MIAEKCRILFDSQCERDLRDWGRRNKMQLYEVHVPKCILGNLVKYGVRLGPSIYIQRASDVSIGIQNVDRVYALMPDDRMRAALFMYYSMSVNKSWCARRMQADNGRPVSRKGFDYWLNRGREFYAEYREAVWGLDG